MSTAQPSPSTPAGQDVRTTLRIVWRWKWLFLAIVIVIPVAVYFYERHQTKVYRSSALVEVTSSGGGGGIAQPVLSDQLLTIAQLVGTEQVAKSAAGFLHRPASAAGGLLGQLSVSPNTDTGFLTISAQDRDPAEAAQVANAFAHALAQLESTQTIGQLNAQVHSLNAELAGMQRNNPARPSVQAQIAQLQAVKGSFTGGAAIIQPATPASSPSAPATRRSVEIALVIALLLGFGAVIAAESTDRRLRTLADLESAVPWPLLGVLPSAAFAPAHLDDPREQEAFQMLAAALTHFNVDSPPRSVAVISALMDDGKTTVATGIAVASARAGMRVVLIDGDLRRSQAASRLRVQANAGLPGALTRPASLDELLVEVPLPTESGGHLTVLGPGERSLTPAAVLGSERMAQLVTELQQRFDLVVIDTAATLAVGDSLPLLRLVSGVVVVVRLNRSTRVALRRLQSVIASAEARVLGVVATGGGGAATGYGYYYERRRGPRLGRWVPRRPSQTTASFVTHTNGTARNGTAPPASPSADAATGDQPPVTEAAPWITIATREQDGEASDRPDEG